MCSITRVFRDTPRLSISIPFQAVHSSRVRDNMLVVISIRVTGSVHSFLEHSPSFLQARLALSSVLQGLSTQQVAQAISDACAPLSPHPPLCAAALLCHPLDIKVAIDSGARLAAHVPGPTSSLLPADVNAAWVAAHNAWADGVDLTLRLSANAPQPVSTPPAAAPLAIVEAAATDDVSAVEDEDATECGAAAADDSDECDAVWCGCACDGCGGAAPDDGDGVAGAGDMGDLPAAALDERPTSCSADTAAEAASGTCSATSAAGAPVDIPAEELRAVNSGERDKKLEAAACCVDAITQCPSISTAAEAALSEALSALPKVHPGVAVPRAPCVSPLAVTSATSAGTSTWSTAVSPTALRADAAPGVLRRVLPRLARWGVCAVALVAGAALLTRGARRRA